MAQNTVEDIKNKLSIVDVVTPYVKLKKAGRYYKGLSPFTNEKTPSFFVSPDRGSYYCFSTSQGGDIFTFVEKMEGVDFKGALKILAEKAGVEIVYEAPKQKDARDKLYFALSLAEQFYKEQLRESDSAKEYAKKRGITGETARTWGLGFAPDEWRSLLGYAEGKGVDTKTLLNAGLIKESEGKKGTYYDRFRNRLMFPIRDIAGRVVGFTGRALNPEDEAKYLNSPETEVFKKSDILYGLDMAKQEMRSRGYVLVCEGQMDVILSHQAGFENSIALSGTAFTDTQLGLIHRFTKNIMLALDSDKAGIASAEKSALAAIRKGSKVKVVVMPEGKDPADIISADPKDYSALVKKSVHVIDFLTAHYMQAARDTRHALELVEGHVLPLVRVVNSPIEREHFVGEIAQVLGVSASAVQEALMQGGKEEVNQTSDTIQVPTESTEEDVYTRRKELLAAFAQVYSDHEAVPAIEKTIEMVGRAEEIPERIYFEIEQLFGEDPKTEDVELFRIECEKEFIRQELKRVRAELTLAERAREEQKVEELVGKISELTKHLQTYS